MTLRSYKPCGRLDNQHLLTLADYSVTEIFEILLTAASLKAMQKRGQKHEYLRGQTLAMIFAKSSTRTRVSFEQGIRQLGGNALFLSTADIQLGRGETISDTVRTLARYNIDGIMIRTFAQSDVVELASAGTIPIINGLTDMYHPCQALADMLTIFEVYGRLKGIKLAYFGDGNNVAHSLMIAGAKLGMDVTICCPPSHMPDGAVMDFASKFGDVRIISEPEIAAAGADVLYTDVFFSMGQENDATKRAALMPYQVNESLMGRAKKEAVFMHCLPAHRGEEVTTEVIDGPHSIVFEQAENRLHAQKAVMKLLMSK